ncbi:MAG: hypothetical protein JWM19_7199 [Actinomycetia bacterium]|nr:hypothetical protein [Actinomycetes bacterium]
MNARMNDPLAIGVTVAVPLPPDEVLGYFTNAARYVTWMGRSARINPVPGGAYYVEMADGFAAAGTFTEIDPPRRLAFTWGWAPGAGQAVLAGPQDDDALPPGSSQVTVTLEEDPAGTSLTLTHRDLPTDALRKAHQAAWQAYLGRLVIRAGGGDPGPDPHG